MSKELFFPQFVLIASCILTNYKSLPNTFSENYGDKVPYTSLGTFSYLLEHFTHLFSHSLKFFCCFNPSTSAFISMQRLIAHVFPVYIFKCKLGDVRQKIKTIYRFRGLWSLEVTSVWSLNAHFSFPTCLYPLCLTLLLCLRP